MSRFFRTTLIITSSALLWAFFFYGIESSKALTIGKSPTGITTGLNSGLVGWWTMDGTDCGTGFCLDKSGNSNTASQTTGSLRPTYMSGKIGQAGKFTSPSGGNNGQYFSVGTVGSTLTENFTVSAWIKTKATHYQTVIARRGGTTQWEFGLTNGGLPYFYDGVSAYGGVAKNDNKWHHVVYIINGSASKIIVDGVQSGTNFTANITTQTLTTIIGGWNNGVWDNFDGTLDDLRLYSRVLSTAEIQQLYKQGGGKISKSPTNITTGLNTGLVGWWTFDGKDCGVTNCKDQSVNGNTATQATASLRPVSVVGKIGQGKKFDGVNDFFQLNVGVLQSYISRTTSYTMSAWVYPRTNTVGTIFDIRGAGVYSDRNGLQSWNGAFVGGYWNGSVYVQKASGAVGLNKWHHVVLTNTLGTIALYVDNVAQTGSMGLSLNSTDKIGGNADQFFNGSIDDARLYNRALSLSEIQQLYKMGGGKISKSPTNITTGLNTGLVGWWTFDGKDFTSPVTTTDKSGNGNNGTLVGGVTRTTGKIGQALNFDGVDGYVEKTGFNGSQINSGSVSFWFKAKASQKNNTCLFFVGTGLNIVEFYIDTNFFLNIYGYQTSGFVFNRLTNFKVNDNVWRHAVGVWGSNGAALYVNGVLISSVSGNKVLNLGNSVFLNFSRYFGATGYEFNGSIDDVRIYNRALTQAEITALYKQGK